MLDLRTVARIGLQCSNSLQACQGDLPVWSSHFHADLGIQPHMSCFSTAFNLTKPQFSLPNSEIEYLSVDMVNENT